ncbi:AAA-like domain-containing protein [Desulfococcaceae bacterium HSG9]|nr:AAA-like domain-containing protein [Desulfococcaceae bacterium HSG9]
MSINPYNYGVPVTHEKFVGRWQQLRNIANTFDSVEGHSHALIGGRRFGKSSFLEVLRFLLMERIKRSSHHDYNIFPIVINLKRTEENSPVGIFGLILNTIHQYFNLKRLRNDLGITFKLHLINTKLNNFVEQNRKTCPYQEFEHIIDEFLNVFEEKYGISRIVIMLDEVEYLLNENWATSFLDKLRSLIYDSFLKKHIRIVIAGSSKVLEARQKGSPLLNMLELTHLHSLKKEDVISIVKWAGIVPKSVANEVFYQCGGHPFIAQYLMYYIWQEIEHENVMDVVSKVIYKFKHERYADIYQWNREIGDSGQDVYRLLVEHGKWLTEKEIRKTIHDKRIKVDIALTTLCYHGLAIHDGSWKSYRYSGELFKSWFMNNSFASTERSAVTQNKDPLLKIIIKKTIFPTAFCYSLTKDEYPLITCKIDNSSASCGNCRVSVEAEIQGYSKIVTDTKKFSAGKTENIRLLTKITHESLFTLNEIRPAYLRVIIKKHDKSGVYQLEDKTYEIKLHAANTALLAIKNEKGIIEDLADYLSVFVIPHTEEIEKAIKLAAERHPELCIVGYQGAMLNGRETVRSQANAIFNTLKKDYQLLYTNAPRNFGKEPKKYTQRVRLPHESIMMNQSQANCIDGTVLFASLLENIGIEPLITIVKGHAFVGWRTWRGVNEYDFLETTMIGTGTFKEALDVGNEQYKDAINNNYDKNKLFDPIGFLRIVDVTKCRKNEITPLL